ncbi:MAG: hypothetical protein JSR82_11670 [Verrucomicrobia bacterium]|nr:hypothetical protein [Verrucomicrobiota bacterium]
MPSALRRVLPSLGLALGALLLGACSSAGKVASLPPAQRVGAPRELIPAGFSRATNSVELNIKLDERTVRTYAIRNLPRTRFAYTLVLDPGGLLPPAGDVRLTFRNPNGGLLSTHVFKLAELPALDHYRQRGRIESEPLEWARNFDLEVTHSAPPKNGRSASLQLQGLADGSVSL